MIDTNAPEVRRRILEYIDAHWQDLTLREAQELSLELVLDPLPRPHDES